jgi:ATP-dependent DNA helicase RecQ
VKPKYLQELRLVSGFGEKKTRVFGQSVLAALRCFREGARASNEGRKEASSPAKETQRLLEEGRTFEEIAQIRGRRVQAVIEMVAKLVERGDVEYQLAWLPAERYDQISAACRQLGMDRLKPLKEALPPEISYEEIRLVIARLRTTSNPV